MDAGFEMVVVVGFGQIKRPYVKCRAIGEGNVRNWIVRASLYIFSKLFYCKDLKADKIGFLKLFSQQ